MTAQQEYLEDDQPEGVNILLLGGNGALETKLGGASSFGAMNARVPPSNVRLDDIGFPGSKAMVINPKSARRALECASFVMRMFAYRRIGR